MTPKEFASTPLGLSVSEKLGWTEADYKKLAWYWPDATMAANEAHQNPASRGRAALKVKLRYAKMFGATPDDLVRIEHYDRGGMNVVGTGIMPEKFVALFYCGHIMATAPGLTSMTIDDTTRER